jgi:hypothetical protein
LRHIHAHESRQSPLLNAVPDPCTGALKILSAVRHRRILQRSFIVALAAATALPLHPAPASARNLLDMLFGGGPRYEDEYPRYEPRRRYRSDDGAVMEPAPRPPRNRGAVRSAAPRPAPPAAPPKPEPVAKMENARKVLVVGDFLAGNVGGELETTFEASPGVAIIDRSDGSSGLVRTDHLDWPAALPSMLDEANPAVVVVMLGANDRQMMSVGDGKEKFRSETWLKEYTARIDKLAEIVTSRKIPLLWVGLPSFQSPSLSADAVTLNAMYRNEMEKLGGEFVDVWDGFADEDGKFVVTGSDINGQQVRLRNSDGITFTKAGKQKLAFYVERFVRRHLGEIASPDVVNLDAGSLPALTMTPSPDNPVLQTQPISLLDPNLDGGKELLGPAPAPATLAETPREKLVRRGELPQAPAGRIDDYSVKTTQ